MKRYMCLLALTWLACVTMPVHAGEDHVFDDHAALVKNVTGVVKVTRRQKTFDATSGTTLQVSDHVVTAPGASAAIVFRDGTLLTLGSGADILVRDYVFAPKENRFAFELYLARGSAIYESGKIGKLSPQSVKVETPRATVGVRGTRFLIEAN
ncbi:MAG: FecR family protein [Rhodanobacter sp.]